MKPAVNIPITFAVETSALDAGDVVSTTIEIPDAVDVSGGGSLLSSLTLLDEADQGAQLDVYFLRSNVSLGTVDSAPNISDANSREIIGVVSIATTDYVDFGGGKIATIRNIGLLLTALTGTSVYVTLVTSGTPTYGAAGAVKASLGVIKR